ncbi:extracellular solute-binding protein [Paenibacillus eucommiae]|uniref:ABC-type glycerol-3-phosphate transport system substrate-binding protein n=1 Tax=Paenibacillus eucommiae TaxID=1355755 RepID=A0ABS4J4G6_9BACL|nr:extracellular solute-binding protein [Paenibacillus eucommiae]MBP1994737.1 ABC-type glycerol-3-phosphate transport system substrate-binding protein [Paenibacillus eucommiae]
MRKRNVVIMLCLLLVLTACSSGKTEVPQAVTSTPGTSSPEVKAEPTKAYILTKVEAGTELPGDKEVGDFIKSETNVEPVMIKPPAGTYDEKLNIMLASDDPLDAFIVGDWTVFQKKGMIQPLNDLLKITPELVNNYTKEEWDAVTDKKTGNIYAIPFASTPLGNAPRIRKDWLDALGLQVPTTLDELDQVLEAFKKTDKFGNNVIPLATHLSFSQLDRAFAGLFTKHGDGNWIDTDGSVKPAVMDPDYKDFIAKMAEWYSKGYIWKEAFSQEYTVINDLVSQNRVGVLASWISVGLTGIETLMQSDPKAQYVFLDKFDGPAGSAYSLRLPERQGIAISVKSKHAEAVMKFFDWSVSSKKNRNVIDFGLENKHWKWIDEEKGIIEKIQGAEKQYSAMYSLVQGALSLGSSDDTISGKLWTDFYNFVSNPALDLKKPADYGVNYDEVSITGAVPAAGDIDKFRDKWLVKFITGQEPLSKWDGFIRDLGKMGLDKMIAERTKQYNEQ